VWCVVVCVCLSTKFLNFSQVFGNILKNQKAGKMEFVILCVIIGWLTKSEKPARVVDQNGYDVLVG